MGKGRLVCPRSVRFDTTHQVNSEPVKQRLQSRWCSFFWFRRLVKVTQNEPPFTSGMRKTQFDETANGKRLDLPYSSRFFYVGIGCLKVADEDSQSAENNFEAVSPKDGFP